MIFSITNPTELVDWLQIFCKSGWLSPWDPPLQWGKIHERSYRPATHPIHFAAVSPRQNPSPVLRGRYFSFLGTHLENFMSRPNVIPAFQSTPLQNRGRNFVRSKRWPTYMSSTTSTYFCVLTIRKHLLKMRFERSGRGQEPSRGHKFSILENVVLHRDFTSATLASFDVILLGQRLSGQRPSICCRRPRCRLKAPLGLSLLRCASQTRSHPKPCSYSHLAVRKNGVSCLHNFTEKLSNRQEVQWPKQMFNRFLAILSTTTRRTTKQIESRLFFFHTPII